MPLAAFNALNTHHGKALGEIHLVSAVTGEMDYDFVHFRPITSKYSFRAFKAETIRDPLA